MSWANVLSAMLPEHCLLIGIVLLIVLDMSAERPRGLMSVSLLAVAAATAAAVSLSMNGYVATPFPGQFVVDPTLSLAKAVVLALALPVLLASQEDFESDGRYFALVLSSLYGFCLLLSSGSFLTLFLGLELMSLPVYVLVLLAFQRAESVEAALKYLVLGGAASATLLLGVSLLFGSTGSLSIDTFAAAISSPDTQTAAAVLLILAALFLKAAIVPFHAWAPDAYEGASVPVTAYMATIIKAAVLLAALRLFATAPVGRPLLDVLAILPLVSIVWGNLVAMRQDSFRRMIAYSSIAHAGYLFYAFLGAGPGRYESVVFYVAAYGLMNILAFASLPVATEDGARDRLDNLKGLFQRQPFAAVMIATAMLSLAGLPPFPGFVAKFLIFRNVIAAGYTTYAVLGLVGSYLGIYFYLRVIQYMFMSAGQAAAGERPSRAPAVAASLLCLVPGLVLTVFPGWVIGLL